jgi:MFS family permease
MLSSFGAGAVIGGLVFGAIGHRLPRRVTFIVLFVLVGLPFWVLALTPPFPVAVAALLWIGLAAGPINPILMTVFQERIPPEMRGRVFGMIMAIALIAAPLGMVLTGYLLEHLTVTVTLLIIAACYLLVTIGQIFNPALREMDKQQTAPDYV